MNEPLDAGAIHELLVDLDAELAARGARGEIFLVDGAAIALAYDTRRATRDLDAVFAPTDVVRDAARTVGMRHNLVEGWLNDAVKGFLPGRDPDSSRYYEGPALTVDVGSARYLLAMKLFASRVEYDADDIALLYRQLGFTTVAQGLDLVSAAYEGRPIAPKVAYLLEEIVRSLPPADTDISAPS